MKEEAPRHRPNSTNTTCPDCKQTLAMDQVKRHILTCGKYVPTYINNVRRFIDQMSPNYMEFLISQMDIIKDELVKKVQQNREDINHRVELSENNHRNGPQKFKKVESSKEQSRQEKKQPPKPKKGEPKQQQKSPSKIPAIDPTLQLQDLSGLNDPFYGNRQDNLKIECADPTCTSPVKLSDIQRFAYLDECLHTICHYCFRNYVRNNYVKCNGELQCPNKKCKVSIPYIQIKQVVDPSVLTKLENELNSKILNLLVECQKCKAKYQFEKGKPSDAPKKTQQGTAISQAMAKHYAENRFQCPQCRQQQCKNCKEVPYHMGYTCQEFQEHKLKKKCRYCRKALPKGYMSDTGIHSFDDICDSLDCSGQLKDACSKKLTCGHSCCGMIKEKNCLPCLKEECAIKNADRLHGENQNSYCSLCYIEGLSAAPCIQSKCGHIFHLKCIKKRIQLKWGNPRINFRFCQCPLCNQWMEIAQDAPLWKQLQKFKVLYEKIKEKALKRLKHENEDKDARLTDPKSSYYKNEIKYAMAIYAYFQCFECGEPYFGGRKNCAEAMNEAKEGSQYNPKELICPSCCPVKVTDCKKHGKEFISFKCRFCCSVAQWFCWGNTHFCDECHKKQIAGTYVSRLAKDKLPKCEGKGKCPVGGEHGGNGDEYCLGCGICRGDKMDAQDF